MKRADLVKPDFNKELAELKELQQKMPDFEQNVAQILSYHQILLKEINYLKELQPYLLAIQNNANYIEQNLGVVKKSIELKLKV
jgi:hypothetical protein